MTTNDIYAAAQEAAAKIGIPAGWIYAQWKLESGNFKNADAVAKNNYGAIFIPGTTIKQTFSSINDFANYYANMIVNGYPQAKNSNSLEDYITALKYGKSGSYYGKQSISSYYDEVSGNLASGVSQVNNSSENFITGQTPAFQNTTIGEENLSTKSKIQQWLESQKNKLYGVPDNATSIQDIIAARKDNGLPYQDMQNDLQDVEDSMSNN